MTILNTPNLWRENIIWVNETKRRDHKRNATVPKENSKAGATPERFYKRYVHSLIALSFTNEYSNIVGDDFLIESLSPDLKEIYTEPIESNLDLLELLQKIPTLKKTTRTENIYSHIFSEKIFNLESKALKFVLYFMTSFHNLDNLANDYQKVFTERKKVQYESWDKKAYFNQTIAEIYREDFLFTLLLELLDLLIKQEKKLTIEDVTSLYNSYLSDRPTNELKFSYKHLYDRQYNQAFEKITDGSEVPYWYGDGTWNKAVDGKLNVTASKKDNRPVLNFLIPKDVTDLNNEEIESALNFILDLFVIQIDFDSIHNHLNREEVDFLPTLVKDALNIQKKHSKDHTFYQIQREDFYKKETEFNFSQHFKTLFQAEKDNEHQPHYILNPRIPILVRQIAITVNAEIPAIKFIEFLT